LQPPRHGSLYKCPLELERSGRPWSGLNRNLSLDKTAQESNEPRETASCAASLSTNTHTSLTQLRMTGARRQLILHLLLCTAQAPMLPENTHHQTSTGGVGANPASKSGPLHFHASKTYHQTVVQRTTAVPLPYPTAVHHRTGSEVKPLLPGPQAFSASFVSPRTPSHFPTTPPSPLHTRFSHPVCRRMYPESKAIASLGWI